MKLFKPLLMLLLIAATVSAQPINQTNITEQAIYFCQSYGGIVKEVNITTRITAQFCYIGKASCEIKNFMNNKCMKQIDNSTTPVTVFPPWMSLEEGPQNTTSPPTTITTTLPTAQTTTTLPRNITVESNETPTSTTTPEPTTTIQEPVTTIPDTTIPIPATPTTIGPICGNLIQEIGEECDTDITPCGLGDWLCKSCRCIPLQPTTTVSVTSTTVKASIPTSLPKIATTSLEIPSGVTPTHIVIGSVIIIAVIAALVWQLGKEDSTTPKK
jgi:hypothetical protein